MKPTNPGYRYRHVLGPSAAGHTTLSYLIERFDHSGPDQWSQRIDAKEIRLDESIAKASRSVMSVLHAHRMRFKHPVLGDSILIEAPPPAFGTT